MPIDHMPGGQTAQLLPPSDTDAPPVLAVRDICRSFGGVRALTDVTAVFRAGAVYGLAGENGAGKSTLGKILAGVHRPDSGRIEVDGQDASFSAPHQALRHGITMMAQELSLEPTRTVLENVMLGAETAWSGFLASSAMRARFDALREQTGFDLSPADTLGALRLADQQKVEILRCLARGARVIVMDEPAAALTQDETTGLWRTIDRLKASGTTIVLISHGLDDMLRVCDDIVVLRNGRKVADRPAAAFTTDGLITAMIGRSLDTAAPARREPPLAAPPVLSVRGLSNRHISDIDLEVRRGEILGLAGLVGSGRSETLRAIFGADPQTAGSVEINGQKVRIRSPRDAIRAGIALIPESRKEQGLVMGRSTRENISLPHLRRFTRSGLLRARSETDQTRAMLSEVGVRLDALNVPVSTLSGGNQQKALFAKWLLQKPAVLLADEPTRGVDIPAKLAIYQLLARLAEGGMAIVVVTSDMEELQLLTDRLLVLRGGRIQGELPADASDEEILRLSFGLHTPAGSHASTGQPPLAR